MVTNVNDVKKMDDGLLLREIHKNALEMCQKLRLASLRNSKRLIAFKYRCYMSRQRNNQTRQGKV